MLTSILHVVWSQKLNPLSQVILHCVQQKRATLFDDNFVNRFSKFFLCLFIGTQFSMQKMHGI